MSQIQLKARVSLTATGKQRRFSILAYTGGELRVGGFSHPVVVDLSGLEASGPVPIVCDHETSTRTTIGQTSEVINDGRSLTLNGSVTGQSQQVRQVIAQADAGYEWQASIGCSVETTQPVRQGQFVTVNGKQFSGPIIVARKSVLRETSVLPVGADSSTTVNLAATATGVSAMSPFEQWLADHEVDATTLPPNASTLLQAQYDSEQDIQAARDLQAAELRRLGKVKAMAAEFPEIAATAVSEGWDETRTENAVLKARAGRHRPSGFNNNGGSAEPKQANVLAASFAMTAGASPDFLAEQYGEDIVDAATRIENRGASLRTVFDFVLRASGSTEHSNRITDSYIRAAYQASQQLEASGLGSTVSIPGILSNSANKLLLQGYDAVAATWQNFCAVSNMADFKPHTRYRMTAGGEFAEVGPLGKIKHMDLTQEDTYTNQAKTYARMVGLSRQDIINDDLSAFETIPQQLGRQAVLKLEKTVYTVLLGNSGSFFHANNSNLLTGAGSALDIDALTAAEKLFLNRTDANGDPIMLLPEVLLVPPSLSVTANQLTRDTQVVAVGTGDSAAVTPSGNPHAGRFTPVVSPWLENANLSGYSTTKWFLLKRAMGSSGLIEVGFLNGQRQPTIETADMDFSTLGMELRGYWDFGVAFQDNKFGVQNDGA